jgi:threonine dehydrogenase-like Zn-dependent dehydrogenase
VVQVRTHPAYVAHARPVTSVGPGAASATRSTGTQAEYVRIPDAYTSLCTDFPEGGALSDTLPTGFECGVLHGKVQPGTTVADRGAGPVGLAVPLTARHSPVGILMIDLDEHRLEAATRLGRNGDGQRHRRRCRAGGDADDQRARHRPPST